MRDLADVLIPAGVGFGPAAICNGRLTLVSGAPIITTDQLAKTTLYFTPFKGCEIGLYDGADWHIRRFAELSVSLSGLTADKNYDVFVYDNAGALTLELVVWTNDTTRATALALQDGIEVKSGALTHRYLGMIRTTGTTGQCELSFGGAAAGGVEAKLFVWNRFHPMPWTAVSIDTNDFWGYATGAWRYADFSAAMRVSYVTGLQEAMYEASYSALMDNYGGVGIGFDANNAVIGVTASDSGGGGGMARGAVIPAPGYHYLAALEYGGSSVTFYGDAGTTGKLRTGLFSQGWW